MRQRVRSRSSTRCLTSVKSFCVLRVVADLPCPASLWEGAREVVEQLEG